MIKVLIVDDEKPAREEIKFLLKKEERFQVVGECSDAVTTKKAVAEIQPDLLILDINLPGKNGLELLDELDPAPYVIFVTAHDEYAIRAFEANAFDYLLKPVLPERFEKVLREFETEMEKESVLKIRKLTPESRVFIKDGERCFWIRLEDIFLIESVSNYARIHFGDKTALLHRTLNLIEERLPSEYFFRANRGQIINLETIQSISSYYKGGMLIEIRGNIRIEVSQRQAVKFRERMSL